MDEPCLEVWIMPIEGPEWLCHYYICGEDTKACLKKLVDETYIGFDSEYIEENEMDCQDIMDKIIDNSGNGYDRILRIKDLANHECYIDEITEKTFEA